MEAPATMLRPPCERTKPLNRGTGAQIADINGAGEQGVQLIGAGVEDDGRERDPGEGAREAPVLESEHRLGVCDVREVAHADCLRAGRVRGALPVPHWNGTGTGGQRQCDQHQAPMQRAHRVLLGE